MKTIALRFSDNFAPSEKNYKTSSMYDRKNGFMGYSRFRTSIATKIANNILK